MLVMSEDEREAHDKLLAWCRNKNRLPRNLGLLGMRILSDGKLAVLDLEFTRGIKVIGSTWKDVAAQIAASYPQWQE